MHRVPPSTLRQRGAVLISALLILVIMTIIGIAALSTTSLGERMSANMQERLISFFNTESPASEVLDQVRLSDQPLIAAITAGSSSVSITGLEISGNSAVVAAARLRSDGCLTKTPSGYSYSKVGKMGFTIMSTSTRAGSQARTHTTIQGAALVPKEQNVLNCG